MKLDFFTAIGQVKQAGGIWLVHGDEPLLYQLLLDQFRAYWRNQDFERQRFDVTTQGEWREALAEVNALSLFSSLKAIEVHTALKPDVQQLKLLEQVMTSPDNQPFLVVMPKQDSTAQKSVFYRLVEANGKTVNLSLYRDSDRRKVLERIARRHQLNMAEECWPIILEQNQNNLLSACQTLLRLEGMYAGDTLIGPEQLQDGLVSQSRFTPFNLVDALLTGRTRDAMEMLQYFRQTGDNALALLSPITRETANIGRLHAGVNPAQLPGVWPARASQLKQAAARITPVQLETANSLLFEIDQCCKGVLDRSAYDLLDNLVLALRFR